MIFLDLPVALPNATYTISDPPNQRTNERETTSRTGERSVAVEDSEAAASMGKEESRRDVCQ